MKKELTNVEIFEVTQVINMCINQNRDNFRWNYCLQKNIKTVSGIVKDIQASLPKAPEAPVKPEPFEMSTEEGAKAKHDELMKVYEVELKAFKESEEKKQYDEKIKEIEQIKQEVDFYEIDIENVPENANSQETSLFINYLTKN